MYTYSLAIPFLDINPSKMHKIMYQKTSMCKAHSSTTHKSDSMDITQIFISSKRIIVAQFTLINENE